MSKADLDEIKRLFLLATAVSDTFVAITAEAVEDVFGNPVVEIESNSALQASDVFADETSPILVSYQLNLTSELLVITFSETVNASSLDVTRLLLIEEAPPESGTEGYFFTSDSQILGGDPTGQDSTIITIQIGTLDLNEIKSLTRLAVSNETCLLYTSPSPRDATLSRMPSSA